MTISRLHSLFFALAVIASTALAAVAADPPSAAPASTQTAKPVKVFLLVGQSNMQGKGSVAHLDQLVTSDPAKFGHLKKDGKWAARDDVFVIFPQLGTDRSKDLKGKLSVGFGWPAKDRFGPELGFGEVVGDAFDEPVLLIKAAWGGQSLDVDFRPPSAGWDRPFDLNNRDQWKPGSQGWAYKQIFNNIHIALDDLGSNIPELKGRQYEIVGLVWFQGWNDLINPKRVDAYQSNMVHFIHDIRTHLNKPNLPIVIGVMGQDGDKPAANMQKMRAAQAAPAAMDEFKGTVAAVPTAPFWDPTVKFEGGYHYNGSARFYYDAGRAMGEAMLKLLDENKKQAGGKSSGK
ncbi:MAG TPA: sialate O-acetylesterase [Tepidisphaeraceae bacterium]|jgi:alpha-galactosidase|nr:sialate O-acetylesterase [Tepidisphaeraceae bacterium]